MSADSTEPRELSGAELAVAKAVWMGIGGPDGEDWYQAQLLAPDALEAIEEDGYVVISRSLLDELERQSGLGEGGKLIEVCRCGGRSDLDAEIIPIRQGQQQIGADDGD